MARRIVGASGLDRRGAGRMFLLAIAAVALSPPLPKNRAAWITDSDYPRAAYSAGQQGRVTVVITVDESGEPQVCAVRATTAPADLAKLSCTLLVQRARFQPARDERGHPITADFVQGLQWSLPNPATLGDSGYVARFELNDAGSIAGCTVQGVGGQPLDMQTATMCDKLRGEDTLSAFVKKPLQKMRTIELRFLINLDRVGSLIVVTPQDYDFRRVVSSADFEFLDNGSTSKCTTTAAETVAGKSVDACEMLGIKNVSRGGAGDPARATEGHAIFDVMGFYR
jgi:TonB family protein